MTTHAQRQAVGEYGEGLAARHLQQSGLAVLDRNWRCSAGEIDIVARDGDVLVVCEVKTRSTVRYGTPFEAITATKAARLHRLGYAWAKAHGVRPRALRVDVVTVLLDGCPTIEHVVGAV